MPWVHSHSGLKAVLTHSNWFDESRLTENVNSVSLCTWFEVAEYLALPESAVLDV